MQVKKQQLELDMEQQTFFQIGKGVCEGSILWPCWLNFYAEYIIWDEAQAGWSTLYEIKHKLDEAQAGFKIARRNFNNLRYADGTTLMA